MNNRIKIKSQISLWQFIITSIILFGLIGGLLYFIFTQDVSHRTSADVWGIIAFIIFVIPVLYSNLINKTEYLSDIHVYDNEIVLTYKIRDKVSRTIPIEKNNIQKFKVNANIELTKNGKYATTNVSYKFFIDLIEGQDVSISQLADLTLIEGNYKFLYRLIDGSKYLPNFELNISSNSEAIKAELEYYQRFGKKIPFWTKAKIEAKNTPIISKILLLIAFSGMIFCFAGMIYISLPPLLSTSEKNYITHIDNSYDCNRNYSCALSELDKARNIISQDAYLYYRYAYIYERKKEYQTAINYANMAIPYLKKKDIYHKKYKFLNGDTDGYLYLLLGDCYKKQENWQKAIEAYSYIINNKKYKYDDSYFERGQAYYHLGEYIKAKQDFLKHKEIILNYLEYQSNAEYKAKYPTYTNKHLGNIHLWIKACDKY